MRLLRWLLIIPAVIVIAFVAQRLLGDSVDERKIERAITAVVVGTNPSSCEEDVTASYLRQETGQGPVFSDGLCRNEAGLMPADSVDVVDIEIDGEQATAAVTEHGGGLDGSRFVVALVRQDGDWKLDRITRFDEFDRPRFERAYRRYLLRSGTSPEAADCLLERTERFAGSALERVLLNDPRRVFGPLAVACDRPQIERGIREAAAGSGFDLPATATECVARKVEVSSDAELSRLQLSPMAYLQLILRCEPEAILKYVGHTLASNGDLDPAEEGCVLATFRRLPEAKAIRLTYDQDHFGVLVERCRNAG